MILLGSRVFVIFLFHIYIPNIVVSAKNILCRVHGSHHRVILVVITMLAIATNRVEIWNLVYVVTNAIDIFFITVVNRRDKPLARV
jgi:hypothetical protein